MTKILIVLFFSSFLSSAWAQSCFPLYQAEADKIQKRDGFTDHIGGQFYINNGQIGYYPGIPFQGKIHNWARDLVDAIKWGPYTYPYQSEDPRKAWLKSFRSAAGKDCDLPKDDHQKLRSMLEEMMEDGSFCPEGKILESTFLKPKANFKKIFKEAVKNNRFPQYCQSKAVVDESFRQVKEAGEQGGQDSKKPANQKQ